MSDEPESLVLRYLRRIDERMDRWKRGFQNWWAELACWSKATRALPDCWIRWNCAWSASSAVSTS